MARRAAIPLNNAAIQAADDEFYRNHPEFVRADGSRIPLDANDPKQAALRGEWLDLYAKHGGAMEGEQPPSPRPPDDPVKDCPICGKALLQIQVLDDTGTVVPDATVTVVEIGKNRSDQRGMADYGEVEPGVYSAFAEKDGYTLKTGAEFFDVPPDATTVQTVVLQPKSDFIVFLTFDDGPEAGTREVYDLLKSMGVKGSFFLVGESATHYTKHVDAGFVRTLFTDGLVQVANHSHTHAHQFYSSFYTQGLRINRDTLEPDSNCPEADAARRSVLMDFEYASLAFTNAVAGTSIPRPADPSYDARGTLDLSKLTSYTRTLPSRMPGSNIWRLPGVRQEFGSGTGVKVDEADELASNGYQIYGWDHEFQMTFDVAEIQRQKYLGGEDGHLDLYSDPYIDLDRPTETGEQVFAKVKAEFDEYFPDLQKEKKLILLMHERAFRRYRPGDESKYTNYLKSFIQLCQKEGYRFDVVRNY